jgi:endo-1,4-beta-xylanase
VSGRRWKPACGRLLALALSAALAAAPAAAQAASAASADAPSLAAAFRGDFLVGTTLNVDQVYGRDARGLALARRHFNAISPENLLKWEFSEPEQGRFAFEAADRYVEFGERNGMAVIGHTLVWHNQTPAWVFRDAAGNPVSRDTLLARMHAHIAAVVGRYRGRIRGWDVVNEALDEDGSLRQTPWLRIIGPDYIAQAFRFAHEADPGAELYYNDYSLENSPKRAGAVRIVRELQAQGIPITAVGIQGHMKMDFPTAAQEDSAIVELSGLGVKVMITELDVDVLPRATPSNAAEVTLGTGSVCGCAMNPFVAGLPDSVQQALARRYADFFAVYRRHRDVVTRVTLWGVTDGDSWLNDWPLRGRTNHPLLFGWRGETKPAFDAVLGVASAARSASTGAWTVGHVGTSARASARRPPATSADARITSADGWTRGTSGRTPPTPAASSRAAEGEGPPSERCPPPGEASEPPVWPS